VPAPDTAQAFAEIDVLVSPAFYATDCPGAIENSFCDSGGFKLGGGLGLALGTPISTNVGIALRTELLLHRGSGIAALLSDRHIEQNGLALAGRVSTSLSPHVSVGGQLAGVVYDHEPDRQWPLHAVIAAVMLSISAP
jgi:hypothetical protein